MSLLDTLVDELTDDQLDRLAERLQPRLAERRSADPWMTVDDAAAYLNCGKQRIYNLVSARRVRFAKDGSRVLFRRTWLDQYVEKAQ